MVLREEQMDLFSVSEQYYLVHCISADFGMGKGIVVEFNRRFDMKNKLMRKYHPFDWAGIGECILEDRVFNLITKEKYWNKPTYKSLEESLLKMRKLLIVNNINKIAMPRIGSGLDKLEWSKVKEIINKIFNNDDIEILVCYL